jgi:hypothetical protein
MIFNPDTAPGRGTYYFRDFEAAAQLSKLEPIAADARSDAEIETVVTSLGGEARGGVPHREAPESEDRPTLPVDREVHRDGEPLLHLRARPQFRPVLPQILLLL